MLVRREVAADIPAVRDVHAAAFAGKTEPGTVPIEVPLLDALRADPGWLPALGLGPLGVLPAEQGTGVGSALMHAALGAADALNEPIVVLLGHRDYYPRFGFRPAVEYAVEPPDPTWGAHFQVRPLAAYTPDLHGPFTYAAPFAAL